MNRIIRKQYKCNRLGGQVNLTIEYFQLQQYQEQVSFECNSYEKCGVRIEQQPGQSWTFDWSRREHPDNPHKKR